MHRHEVFYGDLYIHGVGHFHPENEIDNETYTIGAFVERQTSTYPDKRIGFDNTTQASAWASTNTALAWPAMANAATIRFSKRSPTRRG